MLVDGQTGMGVDIPKAFSDEGDDVAAFLVVLGVTEGFIGGVELGDLGPCFLLDIRSLSEKRNAPLEESCDCVEPARKHSEADGCEFSIVELGLLVEDDVGLDAWFVCPLLHAILEALVQAFQVHVTAISHLTSFLGTEAKRV